MESEFSQSVSAHAYTMHTRPAAGRDQPFSQGRATSTQALLPPTTARRRRSWAHRRVYGDRTGPGDRPRQVGCTAGGGAKRTVGFSPLPGAPIAARRGERRQPTWADSDRRLLAPGIKERSWGVPHALLLYSSLSPRLRMQRRGESKRGRRLERAERPPR